MGIEEDLASMLKYAKFGDNDPLKMIRVMMATVELNMLKRMRSQIDVKIDELEVKGSGPLDPFSILGVTMNSTKEEVTKAYREKAVKAHPDRGGSHEEMVRVNAARDAIFLFKGWKK